MLVYCCIQSQSSIIDQMSGLPVVIIDKPFSDIIGLPIKGPESILNSLPKDELYERAIAFKEAADYDNYIVHMTMAANLGHVLAIEQLYDDYVNDHIHEKQDYSKTLKFYESTIEYAFSASYLGWMHHNANGVQRDDKRAIELYQMAIKNGDGAAMNNLATMYYFGKGIQQDYDKAIELYQMAIEKGINEAMSNLKYMQKLRINTKNIL